MSEVFRRFAVPLLPAVAGWAALAALALPEAVRLPVTLLFLLTGPGTALARLVPGPSGRTRSVVLAGALGLAVETLVAVALYLGGWFTPARAVLVLALLTTLAVLARPPFGRVGLAGLLLLVSACGGGGTGEVWNTPGARITETTAGASSAAAPAPAGDWRLVLQDEFDGTVLNTRRWATCYDWNDDGCTNKANHELEWYLPSQATVGGGALTLTAQRRPTTGADGQVYPWTSGMVTTGRDSWDAQPRQVFTRGYFAAAVRIPPEGGMFPAFWLMPAATRTTPPELDVVEFIGSTDKAQFTVHWAGPNGQDLHDAAFFGPADFPAGYHVFALAWERDALTWYVDGVARHRETRPERIPDQPMELLLNLAVGYPAAPPDGVDTARMQVDWVRVWQH
ncbi:family 16 glycosylhydrolase [Kitasatospora sp. NPDC051853]|uniref:glycoside hydrolase family 16 protein n=1 Tax=Kitasatospora sp. NPDC051853 TaxID=3364058 RepID=UPI0037AE18FA